MNRYQRPHKLKLCGDNRAININMRETLINNVWVTWYIWIKEGSYLPFHETVGGHRTRVMGILSHMVNGNVPPTISPQKDSWVTGDQTEGMDNYNSLLKEHLREHIITN